MESVNEILEKIGEDKFQNLSTTSLKFKRDVWDFFQNFKDKNALELGTHKGQTSRLMSYLFKQVYTVNRLDNIEAKELNKDINNIKYISNFELYNNTPLNIDCKFSLFFLDAGHRYEELIFDINRVTSMLCEEDCYILFDDYGSMVNPGIKQAVTQAVDSNVLEIVKFIGHQKDHNFDIHVYPNNYVGDCVKNFTLEFEMSYSEFPPSHLPYNMYCVLKPYHFGKPFRAWNYKKRDKDLVRYCDKIVMFKSPYGDKDLMNYIKESERLDKPFIVVEK